MTGSPLTDRNEEERPGQNAGKHPAMA